MLIWLVQGPYFEGRESEHCSLIKIKAKLRSSPHPEILMWLIWIGGWAWGWFSLLQVTLLQSQGGTSQTVGSSRSLLARAFVLMRSSWCFFVEALKAQREQASGRWRSFNAGKNHPTLCSPRKYFLVHKTDQERGNIDSVTEGPSLID